MRGGGRTHLSCHERGRLLLVPVGEVLYFKADLKYVTARTVDREYLLDEALTHLESEFADRFMRLHRAVLVAKTALAGFEKAAGDDAEAYGWALLRGVPEKLPVSRRQWAPAKAGQKASPPSCAHSVTVDIAASWRFRATFRASSWMLRAILRISVFGQHRAFSGQLAQSRWLARYTIVSALVIRLRGLWKAAAITA
jgi:hypothetical protein